MCLSQVLIQHLSTFCNVLCSRGMSRSARIMREMKCFQTVMMDVGRKSVASKCLNDNGNGRFTDWVFAQAATAPSKCIVALTLSNGTPDNWWCRLVPQTHSNCHCNVQVHPADKSYWFSVDNLFDMGTYA